MKKMLLALMAIVLMISILAGCGGKEVSTSDGEVELTWYFFGEPAKPDNELVFNEANTLIKEKLGFTVDFQPIDTGSYEEKMKMIIASGENYDICWTSNWRNDYLQNVSNGAFLEIDELLENDAPELKNLLSKNVWDAARVNGKIYGVPNQQIMARSTALIVPTEYYNKYGDKLEGVKDYNDLTPYFEAYANDVPETAWMPIYWQDLSYAYGIEPVLGKDLPVSIMFEGDDPIEVFNLYETDTWKSIITTRKMWRDNKYTLQATQPANMTGYNIEEYPLQITTYKPGLETEKALTTGYPVKAIQISDAYFTQQGAIATMQALNVGTENPTEAIKFLEYLNTDSKLANLICYGIEGKHYEKIDENTIKITNQSGYSATPWEMCNVFNTFLKEGDAENVWEETKRINDTAKTSRILGFNADTTNIKLEINNCKSVVTEYMSTLETGMGDVLATNEEMLKKLKAAGIDTIIAEIQKQIDEWQKTN